DSNVPVMTIVGAVEVEGGLNLISAAWQCAVMTTAAVVASKIDFMFTFLRGFLTLPPFGVLAQQPHLGRRSAQTNVQKPLDTAEEYAAGEHCISQSQL